MTRKKAEVSGHKTDISSADKKNTAEETKVKFSSLWGKYIFLENPASQPNETKNPTLLPNLLLATQVYSRPSALVTSLSKGFRKDWRKSFSPYSKAGHQACGGVGFDNGKPFCVAVNLSAPLMYRAIGFFLYKS